MTKIEREIVDAVCFVAFLFVLLLVLYIAICDALFVYEIFFGQ